jgi:SAM-dependent methyltransferase
VDPAYAAVHAEEDRAHWWFQGRRAILLAELARLLPGGGRRVAEIGCGSGGLLEALKSLGTAVGVEMDPALRGIARARGLDVRAGSLPDDIPLEAGRWDAACLFDVLEHVTDEAGALRACRRLLAPGGRLVVTVPAYAWLWSRHDELWATGPPHRGSLRAVVNGGLRGRPGHLLQHAARAAHHGDAHRAGGAAPVSHDLEGPRRS